MSHFPYIEILAGIPLESRALTELVGVEEDSRRQSNEFLPEKSNECDVKTDESAVSRVVDDAVEWTMTPRKACREATVRICERLPGVSKTRNDANVSGQLAILNGGKRQVLNSTR